MKAVSTEASQVTSFDPAACPPGYLYKHLADYLARLIGLGVLAPNTPLPSERRLAEQFGVSLGTARHATRLLRSCGLLVTIRSKGTYVRPLRESEACPSSANPAELGTADEKVPQRAL
ncbi:winged helix-turn-helix domain-containing protein [Amycolatopsis cynarae]|uniref:Winged helix-turn-helix domain-containing protein n=1 Tax=Amycolatopsis cynarae TaxID=2995223 RepID=A0ABY7AVM8_9PSEU|nr:winged helix-turn-helix domain-containing protein [Amycolatopsis sp. HUAS 11-8]WAL63764.1 winged helix-turn-helix domain-containing protein [Amycolatopsis sp. HUAS 11-8]